MKPKYKRLSLLLITAFAIIIYLPYIINGGFIIDDWHVVYNAFINKSYWATYYSWFPTFSNRPLVPFILAATGTTFKTEPAGYIITNLCFWFLAIITTNIALKKFVDHRFHILFTLFGLVPAIASTVIFSPGMQLVSTVSIFIWSLSLFFTTKYIQSRKIIFYIISNLLILISLLIYEITLPLLVISTLFPIAVLYKEQKGKWKLAIKYFSPLVIILGAVSVFQKIIMPYFMPVYSRLKITLNPFDALKIGLLWAYSLLIETPKTIIYSVIWWIQNNAINPSVILSIITITLVTILLIKSEQKNTAKKTTQLDKRILLILIIALLSTSLLFILANAGAKIKGYDNRAISSIWIIISLLAGFSNQLYRKKILLIVTMIFLTLFSLSFLASRDNFITSYKTQKKIISTILIEASRLQEKNNITIISNVPRYLENNFNNEEIFNNPFDLGFALAINSNNKITGGNTFTKEKIHSKFFSYTDDQVVIDEYKRPVNYYNLFFYYISNENIENGILYKINNKDDLTTIIKKIY